MHYLIYAEFQRLVKRLEITGRVLEIGAVPSGLSLLAMEELADCERVGINLSASSKYDGFSVLQMNGNDMHGFEDASFDAVISNATLEHDPRFWLTCAETLRVLRPGGVSIVGVPGFTPSANVSALKLPIKGWAPGHDFENATLAFMEHGAPEDFYRFSRQAMRQVFFDGYEDVEIREVMKPPRFVAWGRKRVLSSPEYTQRSIAPQLSS